MMRFVMELAKDGKKGYNQDPNVFPRFRPPGHLAGYIITFRPAQLGGHGIDDEHPQCSPRSRKQVKLAISPYCPSVAPSLFFGASRASIGTIYMDVRTSVARPAGLGARRVSPSSLVGAALAFR